MNTAEMLFSLLRSLLFGKEQTADIGAMTDEELRALLELAAKHDLVHLAALALEKTLPTEHKLRPALEKTKMLAVYRTENIRFECEQIETVLSEAKIPFVMLKGAEIRNLYPEAWMRTSCDIDVLVPENLHKTAVSELCDKLSYGDAKEEYHDVSIKSPSGVNLELHFSILEDMPSIDKLLSKAWEHTVFCGEGTTKKKFTPEYFVFHHIAHMSYHILGGGCGIRPFLDLFFINSKMEYDRDRVLSLCRECSLEKLFCTAEEISHVWFGDMEHTPLTARLEEYILDGGVYGTKETHVESAQARKGGKGKYVFSRLFMPYKKLKTKYKILEKHPVLTPVYQVVRWGEMLFGGKLTRSVDELKTVQGTTDEKREALASLFDELKIN